MNLGGSQPPLKKRKASNGSAPAAAEAEAGTGAGADAGAGAGAGAGALPDKGGGTGTSASASRSDFVGASRPRRCPYLPTINRTVLDFDHERRCSVTLRNDDNVYCCCVCGVFFSGRAPRTPAYTHAVEDGHYLFMKLSSAQIFCLPDGYEVQDTSLQDLKLALQPTFTPAEIANLDSQSTLAEDVHHSSYLPGFIGLNNLGQSSYFNVIFHLLGRIRPLRNFFLSSENERLFFEV